MTTEGTTAVVAKPPETPLDSFRAILSLQKDAIAQIIPKTLSPERLIKLAIVAASKNPKLIECTKESFLLSFMQCVELGLEPNSPLGLAYLIPYYNGKTKKMEVQFQLGYKGLLALIRRSEEVGSVNAYAVHKNDKFSISLGDSPHIEHEPTVSGDPGELIGAYMVAELKSGQKEREWMTRAEILKIKGRSQAVQASEKFKFKTPWDTDEGEMFRKTVLKRGGKRLPISTEVAEVIERENVTDYGAIDMLPTLPPMPGAIVGAGAGEGAGEDAPDDPAGDADDTARTIEDEIREVGECLGKKGVEINALIKQHAKASSLETLRDLFRAEYQRRPAGG